MAGLRSWVWYHASTVIPVSGVKSDRSRCSVGFGWPASVYPHSDLFLDQNPRLFSISDVKTWCFIIWSRRFTLDSLKIPFSVQIGFVAAIRRHRGVNRGSIGPQDPLAWSPNKMDRFCVFTVPSFVNCIILYDTTMWLSWIHDQHPWFHAMMPASWILIMDPWNHTAGMTAPESMIS